MIIFDDKNPNNHIRYHSVHFHYNHTIIKHYVNPTVEPYMYVESIQKRYNLNVKKYDLFQKLNIKTKINTTINVSDINCLFDLNIQDIQDIIYSDTEQKECPICLECSHKCVTPFLCEHSLCIDCLNQMKISPHCNKTCPLCRSKLV